jgi:DNA polymerase/3'-5' exonuclease PolX
MSKFPAEQARIVAESLAARLRPYCTRLEICGSLRRKKPLVSDIEIVYVPRLHARPEPGALFGTVDVALADEIIQSLVQASVVEKRLNINGQATWGLQNKLALHRESGIPVDFFATREECWFNYLICRTGPAEMNARIARLARERGLHWHPYEKGFTRLSDSSDWIAITNERQVFETVGLAYLDPEER